MTGTPHLPPQLDKLIQRQLASGHYQNENDVLSAALELLEERTYRASDPSAFDRAFGMWKGRYQDGMEYQEIVRSDEPS